MCSGWRLKKSMFFLKCRAVLGYIWCLTMHGFHLENDKDGRDNYSWCPKCNIARNTGYQTC